MPRRNPSERQTGLSMRSPRRGCGKTSHCEHLPTSTRAGHTDRMEFVLRDLRHLMHVPERGLNVLVGGDKVEDFALALNAAANGDHAGRQNHPVAKESVALPTDLVCVTADAECPFALRPVRAGSHRRTDPRQYRCAQVGSRAGVSAASR